MNRPENLDILTAIERCLGCSTDVAIEVLERAMLDPLWTFRHDLGALEELARKHHAELLEGGPGVTLRFDRPHGEGGGS
jgi:hypothetical protein